MGKQEMIKYKDKESIKRHKHLFCIRKLSQQSFYVRLRESNYQKLHILPNHQIFTQSSNRNKETTLEPCLLSWHNFCTFLHIFAQVLKKNKKGEKMFKVKDQGSLQDKKKTTTQYHYYQNRVSCGSWRHSPWFKDPWIWIQMTALKYPGQKLMILRPFSAGLPTKHEFYFSPNIIQKK